ncbi:multidrug ABC transporter ATP-binding protein [Sulfodiicoccus acidiphilus]|uniref:Multidrug ABC transporter ATP-binding protein n=1 Tax=Sulfodiicoccus acidiphilus TaxID=1670455 RepID=A0A348B1R1_9CREN|nr:ABC transporter permease [Sulfodiicoccus acidiphilus]BBD72113.1 multidrug ABC transporter ATP-binding protein [Sulfodiicoccus acidiphilus]GGT94882.1 multidrug ABC transporter ATP-binding protein [Sulfodiicoccus acidiphilus]
MRREVESHIEQFGQLLKMQLKMVKSYLPSVVFFSLFFPLGLLLLFKFVSAASASFYVISGTATFYVFVSVVSGVAQILAGERNRGRFSLMLAAGVPRELYSFTIAVSNGISTLVVLPVVIVLGELLLGVVVPLEAVPLLTVSAVLSLFSSSMLGMLLGLGIRSQRAVNQYSNVIAFVLSFFAPVYFPPSIVPIPFRYLTYLEPTTYVSQSLYYSLHGSLLALPWDVGVFLTGLIFAVASSFVGRR